MMFSTRIQFSEEELSQLPYNLPTEEEIMQVMEEMGVSDVTMVYGGTGEPDCGCSMNGGTEAGCCWSS